MPVNWGEIYAWDELVAMIARLAAPQAECRVGESLQSIVEQACYGIPLHVVTASNGSNTAPVAAFLVDRQQLPPRPSRIGVDRLRDNLRSIDVAVGLRIAGQILRTNPETKTALVIGCLSEIDPATGNPELRVNLICPADTATLSAVRFPAADPTAVFDALQVRHIGSCARSDIDTHTRISIPDGESERFGLMELVAFSDFLSDELAKARALRIEWKTTGKPEVCEYALTQVHPTVSGSDQKGSIRAAVAGWTLHGTYQDGGIGEGDESRSSGWFRLRRTTGGLFEGAWGEDGHRRIDECRAQRV